MLTVLLEVCDCSRHLIIELIDWSPNDVLSRKRFVRDWRGRVVQARTNKITERVAGSDTISLRIPLFSLNGHPKNDDGTKY